MSRTIWSIGYEKAAWPDFLATLQSVEIALVIDVRDLPLSRRPGFSKRQLAAGLDEAGINYVHLRALGTPPDGREANRRKQWPRFWEIVESRLATAEAAIDLQRAAELAAGAKTCLLCYEADPCICHRLRVGQILASQHNFSIRHLMVHDASAPA